MIENEKQTDKKIFESATEVFVEKGMDGARMQDIASHAGINKALLHYYYRTKEQLFNAVFEKTVGEILQKFAPVFDENLSLEDKIKFFYREHITFLQKNPKLPLFLLNEVRRNPARIKKLLRSVNIMSLWETLEKQHGHELKEMNITRETLPQVISSVAALSVFPFVAKGILEAIFEKAGLNYDDYIEKRKVFAAEFLIRALKK